MQANGFNPMMLAVLILVLMEDALVLSQKEKEIRDLQSLNPCFNGRCTRTQKFRNMLFSVSS